MVTRPRLVLADEPTGALDSRSSRLLLECLQSLHTQLSATILMVTHDAFSARYASRVIFIKDGTLFHEFYRGRCVSETVPGLRKKDGCLLTGMGGFNLTVALGTFTDLLVVFFDRLVYRIRCRIAAAKQKGCA